MKGDYEDAIKDELKNGPDDTRDITVLFNGSEIEIQEELENSLILIANALKRCYDKEKQKGAFNEETYLSNTYWSRCLTCRYRIDFRCTLVHERV